MARAASSSDYKMEPRVGSGQCSQLSPDIRTAGTSEWSSGPGVVNREAETSQRNQTPTQITQQSRTWGNCVICEERKYIFMKN